MIGGQLAEREPKGVRSRRPFRRRRDPQNVILISRDSSLAALLEAMVSRPQALKILGSGGEFPEPQEFLADTVVLDLPYRVRWAAFQQVRGRYSGRLVVTVSSERETEGWPPDPACWFLVRPFVAEDVLRALRAPVPPGPSVRAPLATRRRSSGREADELEVVTAEAPPETAEQEPVVPETMVLETAAPETRRPEAVVPETLEDHDVDRAPEVPLARLSTDESLWDVDAGPTQPPPPPAIPLEVDLPRVHPSLVMPPVSMPPLAMPPEAPPPVTPPPVTPPPEPVEAEVVEPSPAPVAAPAFEPTRWAMPEPAASQAVTEPGDAAAPAEPRPWWRLRSRLVAEVVGALLLVLIAGVGGIAYGRATAPDDRLDVSAIAPASSRPNAPGVARTSPPTTSGQEVLASAASCLSALDSSDAAISYLVGNIRDDRLSKSIQRYQADRQTCRQRVR
jgi:outer membrane biosynthesis protein TonB